MTDQKLYFENIPSLLIILIPFFLITGPFLSDLALSIVALIFLINTCLNDLKKFYNNIYFKLFILFWFILITSSLLSDNILTSLKNSFFYFRFGIFALCFWYLIEKNEKILNYLFFSILFCFLILIIDGYIQYIFAQNLFGAFDQMQNMQSNLTRTLGLLQGGIPGIAQTLLENSPVGGAIKNVTSIKNNISDIRTNLGRFGR